MTEPAPALARRFERHGERARALPARRRSVVEGALRAPRGPGPAYAAWSMPTGVFLFSDIEGSTRRWLADPEAMSAALAAHDETLVDCMGSAGGVVVKHTGDGLVVRFGSAAAAVAAAADGQRRLAEHGGERGAGRIAAGSDGRACG